jgi:hypothetical protein
VNNLVKNNPQYDKLTLFKKSQKFLDRLLFVFFAEDTGLVPPNAISKIVDQWEALKELDEYKTLYSRFVKFFEQAIEWHNLTYKLYPYFWSPKKRWTVIKQLKVKLQNFYLNLNELNN